MAIATGEPPGLKTTRIGRRCEFRRQFRGTTLLVSWPKSRKSSSRPPMGKPRKTRSPTSEREARRKRSSWPLPVHWIISPCSLSFLHARVNLQTFSEILNPWVLDQVFSFESILAEVKILFQNDPLSYTLIDLKIELIPAFGSELLKIQPCGEADLPPNRIKPESRP